ncbi:glycosyltransferase family 2 protein [Flavobacterium sp. ARAG 55.4]|uniref:glycosyltransferase family 2 protein n=1 Tax=Flavobacterium sp. ARAG 55.4 TaxID=3451357 RepID=UPI003F4722CF
MKISIIIATYNAEKYLAEAISSVIKNKREDYELIIIDGGSKDTTLSIVQKYESFITYYVSEPDKGIYDAWNKGVKASSGEWIMFLGADDRLAENGLAYYLNFLSEFENTDLDYISSKVQMLNIEGQPIWVNGDAWSWPAFQYRMTVAHPGSLHAKKLFDQYGLYNIEYKIVGDYELLLRAGKELKATYLNKITIEMREGGVSDTWASILEYKKAVMHSGNGNNLKATIIGFYMYIKSRINKVGKLIGVNLNRKR